MHHQVKAAGCLPQERVFGFPRYAPPVLWNDWIGAKQ